MQEVGKKNFAILEQMTLQQKFSKGKTPQNLNGFYSGELLEFRPGNTVESIAKLILQFFVPWKGKVFDLERNRGDNIIPTAIAPLIQIVNKKLVGEKEYGGTHAIPFKTSIQKGLLDPIKVFQLNYDLPINPPRVRKIIDELVEIGEKDYLGKAHIVSGRKIRTVAYFRLTKKD